MKPLLFIAIVFLQMIMGAYSQEAPVERAIKGRAGQEIGIAIFTNILPDCGSGPLPTLRLVAPPEHGKIVVKKVRLNATNVKQCLALEVPALVAVYRSAADFEGKDTAVLEVKTSQGVVRLQNFSITVSQGGVQQRI